MFHTMGCISCLQENHTPPAPRPDASQYPTRSGSSGTNSFTWVGRLARSLMSVLMSSKFARTSLLRPSPMSVGFPLRAWFMGEYKPRADGRMFVACLHLPIIRWNLFSFTFFFRISRLISFRMFVDLSCGSRAVLA